MNNSSSVTTEKSTANIFKKVPIEDAPCKRACPAGIDVSRYIRLAREGKFNEAYAVIHERIPFPSILGRVCFAPCEEECAAHHMSTVNEPIAIKMIKRFVSDQTSAEYISHKPIVKSTGKRVAIIGSGPAGLTAAYYLAKTCGHTVTVFEALPKPGGLLRVGIPNYRLPEEILDKEIDKLKELGIEIKTNTMIGSIDKLFQDKFDAVFVAIGAHKELEMGIKGEEGAEVIDCLSFLRDVNLGREVQLGDRVAVIGGGNAAIDAARVARRMGKEITVLYRRTRDEMPAYANEVEEALKEGVEIKFLVEPIKVSRENGIIRLECIRLKLGELDESGRPRPERIQGTEFLMDFNSVIRAIGGKPDLPDKFQIKIAQDKWIEVDPDTLETSKKGVFAGGDVTGSHASVINAVVDGRKAAISIDKYLGGKGVIDETLVHGDGGLLAVERRLLMGERAKIDILPLSKRLSSFEEVESNIAKKAIQEETKRCNRCDLTITWNKDECRHCYTCGYICSLKNEGVFNPLKSAILIGAHENKFVVTFTDKCDDCGLCVKACPYGALDQIV